jgi:hypothetical protein
MTSYNNTIFPPQWVAGFIDGEGCFHVALINSKKMKTGFEVQLQFSIAQHVRDYNLMLQFIKFFNCGYIAADGPWKVQYRIRGITQIENHLLPFLIDNPLLTRKSLDLIDFIKVFELMKAKTHLTTDGIQTIREIQSNMNSRRI